MKNTNVKTSIEQFKNLDVKESVKEIYNALQDKHSFILLTQVGHDGKETPIGIKQNTLSNIETGKSKPSVYVLDKIAEYTKTPLSVILKHGEE